MVIVDANVLLYAANVDAPVHEDARAWLEDSLSGAEPIGFAWVVLLAFLRVATRSGIFPTPLTTEEAMALVDAWLEARASTIIHPGARHATVLRGLLHGAGTAGNLVSDAHLAAIAIEQGARVCSFDKDFGRFQGVRLVTPGTPGSRGDLR